MVLSIIKFGVNGLKRIRVLGHWWWMIVLGCSENMILLIHLQNAALFIFPPPSLALILFSFLSFLQVGFFLNVCLATSPWDITDALQRHDFKHGNCQMYSVNTNASLVRFCVMCNTESTTCRCKDLWITQDPRMMRQTHLKSAWKPSRIFHNGIYLINRTKDRLDHCSFCKYQPFAFDRCPWLSRVTQ